MQLIDCCLDLSCSVWAAARREGMRHNDVIRRLGAVALAQLPLIVAVSQVAKCRTLDQARAVVTFLDAASEKTLRSTLALTASRGRGKSAALGLAIAGECSINRMHCCWL